MTLNDLREKVKAAYPAARQSFISMTSDHANMRQFWLEVAKEIAFAAELPPEIRPVKPLYDFYMAGFIYYHAKKHGLQSAMMLKLSL